MKRRCQIVLFEGAQGYLCLISYMKRRCQIVLFEGIKYFKLAIKFVDRCQSVVSCVLNRGDFI
jgi:hypothetical protein